MSSERAPLLGGKANGEPKSFYFLGAKDEKAASIGKESLKIPSIEVMKANAEGGGFQANGAPASEEKKSWMGALFGARDRSKSISEVKPRKLPIKVEPKVFFANERTFLAWLHMSVTLASISVAIVAFAEQNEWSQIYGLMLMPVAIAFCAYSLFVYIKRAGMIRRKDPGPYEDRMGPIVLASMLGLAIIGNFMVKIYDMAK